MTRGRKRQFHDPEAQAEAVKQIMSPQRLICEGCIGLRTYPRPMCKEKRSPHFRTARDTYHERCPWFAVRIKVEVASQPETAPPPRHELVGHAANDRRLKVNRKPTDDEHAALLARNMARRAS